MMDNTLPVFISKHDIDFIQKALEYYGLAKKDYNKNAWRIIKNLDNQCGGNYPKNYIW